MESLALEHQENLHAANKYLALASFSAVISYAEHSLHTSFVTNSMRIRFVGADSTLLYDPQAVASLELLGDRFRCEKTKGLLHVVDRCQTVHGKALLRANILQPPTDVATIAARQQAALDLFDEVAHENVKRCLKEVVDVDKMRMICSSPRCY